MEKVLTVTSLEKDRFARDTLRYRLSRPPEERLAEAERLRREDLSAIRGDAEGVPEGLSRTLVGVKRWDCPIADSGGDRA